ncbi:UNVERIFIED_CONTAM: hypothetical protein HHA_452350 [Hammondia hammondi]|eukprot:XP_008885465.1 hypothetical protein HHA_452350 [Hammondia hammondi]
MQDLSKAEGGSAKTAKRKEAEKVKTRGRRGRGRRGEAKRRRAQRRGGKANRGGRIEDALEETKMQKQSGWKKTCLDQHSNPPRRPVPPSTRRAPKQQKRGFSDA